MRAYDARTGTLLWDDRFDNGGGDSAPFAIAVKGNRVFAAGTGRTAEGAMQWVVRAYDAKTGAVLWQDRFDNGGGNSIAFAIAVKGRRVFAAGRGVVAQETAAWVVRAYDAKSGAVLWEDQFQEPDKVSTAFAIAIKGKRVFATGTNDQKWLVRTYDAKSGVLIWENQANDGSPQGIAVKGSRVFIAGEANLPGQAPRWTVRAYDAKKGTLLWEDQFDNGGESVANAVAVKGKRVFAAGEGQTEAGAIEWITQAYGAR